MKHCPVCWQPVTITGNYKRIVNHVDSASIDVCPGSGQRAKIAIEGRPQRHMITAASVRGNLRMERLEELINS